MYNNMLPVDFLPNNIMVELINKDLTIWQRIKNFKQYGYHIKTKHKSKILFSNNCIDVIFHPNYFDFDYTKLEYVTFITFGFLAISYGWRSHNAPLWILNKKINRG